MIDLNEVIELTNTETALTAEVTAESETAVVLSQSLLSVEAAKSELRDALYVAAEAAYKVGNIELQKSIYAQIDVVVAL